MNEFFQSSNNNNKPNNYKHSMNPFDKKLSD